MKKLSLLFTMFFAVTIAFGQSLAGSMHDFSSATGDGTVPDTWNTSASNKMCGPCHVPHQPTAETQDPLWSHDFATTAAYGVYGSTTMNATPTELGIGSTTSHMCLSCHDGSLALDAHDNKGAAPTVTKMSGVALVGTDLTNDHPVNFIYDAALVTADGGLVAANDAGVVALLSGGAGGTVQCTSCHNPHDGTNGLLVMSNLNSELCLVCHAK